MQFALSDTFPLDLAVFFLSHHMDSPISAAVNRLPPGLQPHGAAVPQYTLQKPSLILLMGIIGTRFLGDIYTLTWVSNFPERQKREGTNNGHSHTIIVYHHSVVPSQECFGE